MRRSAQGREKLNATAVELVLLLSSCPCTACKPQLVTLSQTHGCAPCGETLNIELASRYESLIIGISITSKADIGPCERLCTAQTRRESQDYATQAISNTFSPWRANIANRLHPSYLHCEDFADDIWEGFLVKFVVAHAPHSGCTVQPLDLTTYINWDNDQSLLVATMWSPR
jgi:hypothetical protein